MYMQLRIGVIAKLSTAPPPRNPSCLHATSASLSFQAVTTKYSHLLSMQNWSTPSLYKALLVSSTRRRSQSVQIESVIV